MYYYVVAGVNEAGTVGLRAGTAPVTAIAPVTTTTTTAAPTEGVATVDASGTITGRTAGTTQVIAVTTASDGALRVNAIPVTVP